MEARWSHISALGGFGRLWGDKEKEGRKTQEERRKQNQKEIYIYKLPINRSSGHILIYCKRFANPLNLYRLVGLQGCRVLGLQIFSLVGW